MYISYHLLPGASQARATPTEHAPPFRDRDGVLAAPSGNTSTPELQYIVQRELVAKVMRSMYSRYDYVPVLAEYTTARFVQTYQTSYLVPGMYITGTRD